jgi:diguanylate cyclase (GGDEF)-like protein/PAS domain S-box-containing protein
MSLFRSIKSRLLVFGLSISLIPITVITVVYYLNARSVLKKETLNWLTAVVESRKMHLLEFMEGRKGRAIDFSSDGFIRDSLEAMKDEKPGSGDVVRALNNHLMENKMPLDRRIAAIAVLDGDGRVVASTSESILGTDMSGQGTFPRTISNGRGEILTGKPGHISFLNEDCIPISAPLFSRTKPSAMGVIVIYNYLSALGESTTTRAGMGKTGEIYLVDQDGALLTGSRFSGNAPLSQTVDKEYLRRITVQTAAVCSNWKGTPVVSAAAYLPEYRWTLLAEMDKKEAFEPLATLGIVALVMGHISAVVAIGVGIIFAFSVSGPINLLQRITERFASGDMGQRVVITRKDEIGKLAGSFNAMADELSKETHKLSRAVEQSPSMAMIVGIDGRIEYVNPKFTQVTGYTLEEIIGKNPRFLKSGKTSPDEYRLLWGVVTSGGKWRGEFCNKKKNGEEYWESASLSAIKNHEGAIIGFVKVAEDITEHKQLSEWFRKLSHAIEQSASAVIITDLRGNIEYVNPKFTQLTGYGREDVIGKNPRVLKSGELPSEEYKRLWNTITSGGEWKGEFHNRRKDGTFFWSIAAISPVKNKEGEITHFVGIQEDITRLKQLQTEFHNIVERSADGIFVLDMDGVVRFVNPAAEAAFGRTAKELVGSFFGVPVNAEQLAEIDIIRRDGSTGMAEMRTVETEWEGKQALLVMLRDVTDRRIAEERIHQMAYYDNLTGLPNRSLFNDRLTHAIAHAERGKRMLAVLFMDLDRFKNVNDTLGHLAGDHLLQEFANRLQKNVRKEDTVSRLGGDEFTVLLTHIGQAEDVDGVVKKILADIRAPLTIAGNELYITTSIGVALYPHDGVDAASLLKNADAAMYNAKEQGRNNYQFYTQTLHERISGQMALSTNLHRALERKEFTVHYQPIIDTDTGRVDGVEALIRWQHPVRGLIHPIEFIPLAEDMGLIASLDEWVLHAVCAQNKAWQEAGIAGVRVSVNVSAYTFHKSSLIDTVTSALKVSGLDARFLEIEITESGAMREIEETLCKLNALRDMGIHITIDDLGTGYSSLSYLKRFPIHTLKIDQSFVRDVTNDPNNAAIVKAIIAMAKGMNLDIIAEGVETEEQFAFLKQAQCGKAQGYLFGRPMPAGDFERLLARNERLPV